MYDLPQAIELLLFLLYNIHKLFFSCKNTLFYIFITDAGWGVHVKAEKMSTLYKMFLENFTEEFSITHKVAPQTEKSNFHMHKQLEIVYTISNNLKCRTEKGIYPIPSNCLVLINCMDLHYFLGDADSGLCDRYVLYFSPTFISHFSTPESNLLESFQLSRVERPVILQAEEDEIDAFRRLMDEMIVYERSSNAEPPTTTCFRGYSDILYIKFLLGQFLLRVNRLYCKTYGCKQEGLDRHQAQMVMEICDFIQEHMQDEEKTSMNFLSAHFHISKTQIYNLFKKNTGLSATGFLTECRITSAKHYLINSEYSVEMISGMVGYRNLSSFSRTFKAIAGCSPLQYRKKHTSFVEVTENAPPHK